MSDAENHHHGKNEVIIIKRHSGDHDGAHGGAWKIAYADFMTAMMAFFLVMWLVNAANEETKASVASYFNPIKLADEKPTQKGLKKPADQADGEDTHEKSKEKAQETTNGAAAATGDDQTGSSGQQQNFSESQYFQNPYSVLAEIAQEVGQQANISVKGEGGASDSGPATGANGGEAYRDPFDPDFWTQQVQVTRADQGKTSDVTKTQDSAALAQSPTIDPATPAADKAAAAATPPAGEQQDVAALSPDIAETPTEPVKDKTKKPGKQDKKAQQEEQKKLQDEKKKADAEEKKAAELRADIQGALGGAAGKLAEGLIVTPSEGGLLVTISDQQNTPMFGVGSAVPNKELVLAMEKIGKVLEARKGSILIRGHTDGRQFKGAKNDNWQLSTARAESAYYMLVRGGLEEKRVQQVSGFADRRLQVPTDPLNDSNRRIEILIQSDQG